MRNPRRRPDTRDLNGKKALLVRMEPELHAKLVRRAKSQRRSANGHLVYLLEQDIATEEKTHAE